MANGDDDILSRVLGQRRSPNLRGHFSSLSPSRFSGRSVTGDSPLAHNLEFDRIMGRDARSIANRNFPVSALDPSLRQFTGTELAPPGAGTYFNPRRYAEQGFTPRNTEVARNNLTRAWQQDLRMNVLANPERARQIESDRIAGQYAPRGSGGGISGAPFGSGRATPETTERYVMEHGRLEPGGRNITYTTPSGGTISGSYSPEFIERFKQSQPRRYFD